MEIRHINRKAAAHSGTCSINVGYSARDFTCIHFTGRVQAFFELLVGAILQTKLLHKFLLLSNQPLPPQL